MPDSDLKEILVNLGVSGDEISYPVFLEFFDKKIYHDVPKGEVMEAFQLFDKDKSGKILIEDFKHIMTNLCEDLDKRQIEHFLELADQKNDGYLHIEEFVTMLKK